MKQLKVIKFKDLPGTETNNYRVRKAVRAVVFDSDNKIGLLDVTKHNYHKLPGGGVESGEDNLIALKRECLEELGCQIKVSKELGSIIEFRDKFKKRQESYCYLAKVVGEKGKPNFTTKEINKGFKTKWVSISQAINLIENDSPSDYEGKFIQIRDLTYLREAESSNKSSQ